ncbi:MAG: hypothetical protein U9R06_01740 [Patescibacteria group bacterium]|nr:hypothetical protein [Patescibacteria group bacterium]
MGALEGFVVKSTARVNFLNSASGETTSIPRDVKNQAMERAREATKDLSDDKKSFCTWELF